MELVDILQDLWRRRLWLALGFIIAGVVALNTIFQITWGLPPSLQRDSLRSGVAQTQFLVDAPESPIADLNKRFDPLVARARIYAKLMASAPVRARIGRRLGVSGDAIVTAGPSPVNQRTGGKDTNAATRSEELLSEAGGLRINAASLEEQPIVSITAQAPTGEQAVKLADAAVAGLRSYIGSVQSARVNRRNVVQIEQLGDARGGELNQDTDASAFILAFIGVFVSWAVGVVLVSSVLRGIREARRTARAETPPGPQLAPHETAESEATAQRSVSRV